MNEFTLPPDDPLNLKTVLAMDFGEKFIGVATFCVNRDPYPTPYGRIHNKSKEQVVSELQKIIDDEFVEVIVIGLPFLTDGQKTKMTTKAQEFVKLISESFALKVFEQDETLSTFEAESRMKTSPRYNFQVDLKHIDAVAASVILEDFIRSRKGKVGL
ncbi:MAG TPA: Holliday junction resolvase RuvX [Bacteriovoracaceae bacterium]|nr:Holliday junction resolvase RuvX [Bacteriovoracaceae bacterium]